MTEISLAWLLTKVTSPVVGATKVSHIDGAVGAVNLELSDEEIYRFANAIQSLYENTYCPVCLSWIQSTNSWDKDISCNCGNLDYSS